MAKQRIITICDKILDWWEKAQYLESHPGHNAFDEEEDYMFDELRKAADELRDEK